MAHPFVADDDGFTIVEMLAALVLTLVVISAGIALLGPNQLVVQAHAESLDMQERMRVGVDAIGRDLNMAGAGLYAGASTEQTGSLINWFAPVLPRRVGLVGGDVATIARADAVSVIYVPPTLAQATTDAVVPNAAGLTVGASPNCPVGEPVCGLQAGMTIAVFDEAGRHDTFSILDVQNSGARIQPHASPPWVYAAGAHVAQVEMRTFYLDQTTAQLRQYDGYQTDVPLVDNVVGLSFEYFGDAALPTSPKPRAGEENCLYDGAGQPKTWALAVGTAGDLVPLPLSMLNDGPWCGTGDTMFDADLLRVRTIRVSLRVQAALPVFRSSGPAFVHPGTNRNSARSLPDLEATFRVTPHNLVVGR